MVQPFDEAADELDQTLDHAIDLRVGLVQLFVSSVQIPDELLHVLAKRSDGIGRCPCERGSQ